MAITSTSKMTSIYIQGILNKNTAAYQQKMEQMSSGSKFNSAATDPIGVTTESQLSIEISAGAQAASNVSMGDDLLEMTEETQSKVIENLQRIRDIAEQAANETYTPTDRNAMLLEIRSRLSYIDKAAASTTFNNINIADGSNTDLAIQIGTSTANQMVIGSALIDLSSSALGGDLTLSPAVTGANWSNTDCNAYIGKIDAAIKQVSAATSKIGGFRTRLDMTNDSLVNMDESLKANRSLIADADVAQVSADLIKYQILQESSANLLTQMNQVPAMVINLLEGRR